MRRPAAAKLGEGSAADATVQGRRVEKVLQSGDVLVSGVPEKLCAKYGIRGLRRAAARLYKDADRAAYGDWLRREVLPRARTDFRLAPEVYAVALETVGVDDTPEEIAALGHRGFVEIQEEMKRVAGVVARERHLPSADYRDVLRDLEKDQIVGEA